MPLYEFHCLNCELSFESVSMPHTVLIECVHCKLRTLTNHHTIKTVSEITDDSKKNRHNGKFIKVRGLS